MTREEQIQKLIDEENGIANYGSADYQVGVCDGVRLADKTLIESLWHDIEERPDYSPQIIYQDKNGFCWVTSRQEMYAYDWKWQRYVVDFQVMRWAYINDLLPKNLVTWQKLIY